MRRSSAGWLFALLVMAGLGGALAWVLRGGAALSPGEQVESGAAGAPREVQAKLPRAPDLLAALDYSAIAERPLFLPERRPPEALQEPEAGSAQPTVALGPPPKVTLSAIIGEAGQLKAMLVGGAPGGEVRLLSEGDSVDGWRLESIGEESVVLAQGERREELQLRTFDGSQPPRPAAAVPPRVTPRMVRPPPVRVPQTRANPVSPGAPALSRVPGQAR